MRGLDFSQAHFFDRWWWLKVRLITDQLERESKVRIYEMQHRMHCASLAITDKPGEAWESASVMVAKVIKELLPWIKTETKDDARQKLLQGWQATYGDPNDPEVADRIRRTAMELVREANAAIRKAMQ